MTYVGRFAPSPSGPLHFGSLVAAFGSWLDARANGGQWLVRIEDLDPPREVAGATEHILASLNAHQLLSDAEVMYQSHRLADYEKGIKVLMDNNQLYHCHCTRKQITALGGLHIRCASSATQATDSDYALRLLVDNNPSDYHDTFHGTQSIPAQQANEDFVVKRKDGLHAYMLAVVVDDIYQGITHVIRGADLAHSTRQQQYLFNVFGHTAPQFGHLPMAMHPDGSKLSKQTRAPAIDDSNPLQNLFNVLVFLNQALPDSINEFANFNSLFDWAINNWDPTRFQGVTEKLAYS